MLLYHNSYANVNEGVSISSLSFFCSVLTAVLISTLNLAQ